MGNPNNTTIMVGRVTDQPKFIKNRNGQEFSCRFVLAVSRNYKCTDGSTKADFLPVHLDGFNRMEFAHKIKKGDRIVLTGCVKSESYQDASGSTVYTIFVDADNVSWTLGSSAKFQQPLPSEEADDTLELEISALPFS